MQRRNVVSKTSIPDGSSSRSKTGAVRKTTKRCSMLGWAILVTGMLVLMAVVWQAITLVTVTTRRAPQESSSSWMSQHQMMNEGQQKKATEAFPKPWNIRPKALSSTNTGTMCDKKLLSRSTLDKSLALGTRFLLKHQKEAGNFDYEYDWTTDENVDDDMEVRQAGALWGLSLIFHDMMDTLPPKADIADIMDTVANLHVVAVHLLRGFEYFVMQNSHILEGDDGVVMRYITYPGSKTHGLGTVGLVTLALVDFLRATENLPDYLEYKLFNPHKRNKLQQYLRELMAFLVTSHTSVGSPNFAASNRFTMWNKMLSSASWKTWDVQMDPFKVLSEAGPEGEGGFFYPNYDDDGNSYGHASSYYDGECLLAIIKAAKYLDYNFLYPVAVGSAQALYHRHVTKALKADEDSSETKGFYQWSSMCFYELATVEFFDVQQDVDYYKPDKFGKWLVDLALWMIDVHETLSRPKNTGYAYEGIVPAWTYAASSHSTSEQTTKHLQCTIEEGLSKLITWQVGMGLVETNVEDWDGQRGLGGVQNSRHETGLRIDTTQHQMHATILTRRLVYNDEITWPWRTDILIPNQ